jgi:acyl CoA:acetate/3-ketoacid CoA transferase
LVNVPTTDLYDLQKMSEIRKGELISSDGWSVSYQERKLANRVAAAQLPAGVVVSYYRALWGRGRDKHYHR